MDKAPNPYEKNLNDLIKKTRTTAFTSTILFICLITLRFIAHIFVENQNQDEWLRYELSHIFSFGNQNKKSANRSNGADMGGKKPKKTPPISTSELQQSVTQIKLSW